MLDLAELTGQISGVKEWNEGFEELRSIPNSFAIVFKEKEPLFVYTASDEEKVRLQPAIPRANRWLTCDGDGQNTLAGFLLTYV